MKRPVLQIGNLSKSYPIANGSPKRALIIVSDVENVASEILLLRHGQLVDKTPVTYLTEILKEIETVANYPSYLEDIQQRAKSLSSISIFAQSSNSFNIK